MKMPAPDDILFPTSCTMRADVLAGLGAPIKRISSKYLYDAEGSRLFEAICDLPEYHVTRTEIALLQWIAPDLAAHLPEGAALVEFGSGASVKTMRLLDAAPGITAYVPIDISASALDGAAERLAERYPALPVTPLVGDFTRTMRLPATIADRPRVGFFPGSTIGNFTPGEALAFLRSARRLLGDGARFILGADITRHPDRLIPAYDDAEGMTAAFNLNLLARLNRELDADFDLDRFRHRAVWNAEAGRVEMHLVSEGAQEVRIDGACFAFAPGETIHTENSHKYHPGHLRDLATQAGWRVASGWQGHDPAPLHSSKDWATFSILLLEAD